MGPATRLETPQSEQSAKVKHGRRRRALWLSGGAGLVILGVAIEFAGAVAGFGSWLFPRVARDGASVAAVATTPGASRTPELCASVVTTPESVGGPAFTVDGAVRGTQDSCYLTMLGPVRPGSEIQFVVRIGNDSTDATLEDASVKVDLADGLQYIPKSTAYVVGSSHGWQPAQTDAIDDGTVLLGTFGPGAAGYLSFKAAVPLLNDLPCGESFFTTTVIGYAADRDSRSDEVVVSTKRSC